MRQQLGLFLASCLVAISSSAAVPVVLKVTERSFQVQGGGSQPPADPIEAQLYQTDPKILTDVMTQIWVEDRPEYVPYSISDAKRNLLEKRAEGLQQKYSQALQEYVDTLAKSHQAVVKVDGGSKIYMIADGVSFFRDFYRFQGQKDPMFKVLAKAFLRGPYRQATAAPLEKLIVELHEDQRAKTFLLPAKDYSDADLNALKEVSRGKGYRFEKVGETVVFGSGISFLLTRDLMKSGLSEKDPGLRSDFAKILRYHQAFQIPVIHGYHQGALAYYNPHDKEMSFVHANAADTNTYTHEMTHSRFDKFTATLQSWVDAKGYVVPFHIMGPDGGLFNLLNELNSFRMGNQFSEGPEYGKSDAEILKFIKENYGLQAGFEATEMLDKVWTPEKVANKSVAYLIYSEIRNFNKLSIEQLLDLGQIGVEKNDMVQKMNFLLMFEAGRFKGTTVEAQAHDVFLKLGEVANERYIAHYYENVAKKLGLNVSEEVQKVTGSSLDLNKATFNQVFKEFSKRGSSEAAQLLRTKFAHQLGPQHIEAFVLRAMEVPPDASKPEGLFMLEHALKLSEMGFASDFEGSTTKVRAPVQTIMMSRFDEAVAKNLFNGGDVQKRLSLLNFITVVTLPEEMPKTFNKLMGHLLPQEGMKMADVILARQIFMPQDGIRGRSALWGDRALKDQRGMMFDVDVMNRVVIYFKESLSPFLTQKYAYGEYAFVNLDAETRGRVLRAMKQLTPDQKESLKMASTVLWQWALASHTELRTNVLYSLISNPMYLMIVEGEMVRTIKAGDPAYLPVNEFLLSAAENLLPNAKAAMANYKAAISGFSGIPKVAVELQKETAKSYKETSPEFTIIPKMRTEIPAQAKSIYGQKLQPIGNTARVVMSCKKVLIAQ